MLRNVSIKLRLAVIVVVGAIGLLVLASNLLMTTRQTLFDARVEEIAVLSESAHSILSHFDDVHRNGDLTLEEAQLRAREALRNMRFDGDNYVYAFTMAGVAQVHGARPDLEGTDMIGTDDPTGIFIVQEFIEAARNGGQR